MTADKAIAIVEARRQELDIRPRLRLAGAEQAIVEYARNREKAGRVEDRVAWIVMLAGPDGFVHVHVDDRTGDILEVLRSA